MIGGRSGGGEVVKNTSCFVEHWEAGWVGRLLSVQNTACVCAYVVIRIEREVRSKSVLADCSFLQDSFRHFLYTYTYIYIPLCAYLYKLMFWENLSKDFLFQMCSLTVRFSVAA